MLREWDPTTGAGSDAIVLRSAFIDLSRIVFADGGIPRVAFVPPVVTGSVPGVAEPPKAQVAVQLLGLGSSRFSNPLTAYFTPDGPTELPAAVRINADSSRTPLPGPHPVLAHAICAGDADLASLRVVQSVARTDVKPHTMPKEFMQRFRVPQQVELRWIELASVGVFSPYFQRDGDDAPQMRLTGFPVIAVIDGEAMPEPVPVPPAPLVESPMAAGQIFSASDFGPRWVSHLDLDRTVTLEPDHD